MKKAVFVLIIVLATLSLVGDAFSNTPGFGFPQKSTIDLSSDFADSLNLNLLAESGTPEPTTILFLAIGGALTSLYQRRFGRDAKTRSM